MKISWLDDILAHAVVNSIGSVCNSGGVVFSRGKGRISFKDSSCGSLLS